MVRFQSEGDLVEGEVSCAERIAKPALPTGGHLLPLTAPGLCAAPIGKNPDTGMPNIALGACDEADRSQHYLPFPANGDAFLNPASGDCLDAEGGSAGAGARIETYGCDGGGNQGWQFADAGAGTVHVVGVGSGLCLAACAN